METSKSLLWIKEHIWKLNLGGRMFYRGECGCVAGKTNALFLNRKYDKPILSLILINEL